MGVEAYHVLVMQWRIDYISLWCVCVSGQVNSKDWKGPPGLWGESSHPVIEEREDEEGRESGKMENEPSNMDCGILFICENFYSHFKRSRRSEYWPEGKGLYSWLGWSCTQHKASRAEVLPKNELLSAEFAGIPKQFVWSN